MWGTGAISSSVLTEIFKFLIIIVSQGFSVQKYNTAEVYRGKNLVKLEKIFCSNAFKTCANLNVKVSEHKNYYEVIDMIDTLISDTCIILV